MHSPWGFLFAVIKETGWKWHYVLWKVSKLNIMLMLADQPQWKNEKDIIQRSDDFNTIKRGL
jgi:hypothetical protein